MALRCPEQQLVYVADREGDMLDLIKKAQQLNHPADWLIRAKHNRSLGLEGKLWDAVDKQPVLAKITFIKPRKKGQKARPIQQEIKVLRCTLSPKSACPVEVTLVYAKEINRQKEAVRLFGD